MADYYPLLSRAVGALDPNTPESRRAVYERARQAIVKQLRGYDPPLSESDITRERLSLEEAVRKIEAEFRAGAASAPPAPPRSPAFPPREAAASGAPGPSFPASRSTGSAGRSAAEAAAMGAVAADAEMSARGPVADAAPPAPRINPPRVRPPAAAPALGGFSPGETVRLGTRSRLPAIAAVLAVLVLAGLGAWAYFARDELSASLGTDMPQSAPTSTMGAKITDRVGQSSDTVSDSPATGVEPLLPNSQTAAAPATVPPPPAQSAAPSSASLVGQRAILYEETPDQKGGTAFQGSIVWRTEPAPNNPAETVLRGDIAVPDRDITVSFMMQRNTDPTLPASHTIDVQFTLPQDFANGGIGSVPGILFKPSEEAGGSALSGLSVKVTNNFFLVGLSAAPKDLAENLKAIRERGWIDIPLLYDNGRRAVLTLEKGVPGERAFEEAMAAWSNAGPVAGGPAAGVPSPR
jgi:hypothetical protein